MPNLEENLTLSFDAPQRDVISVSQLASKAKNLLERHLGKVWVEGELSNLARPSSGHLYFTLKDENAQVRCAMFRQNNRQLTFTPENGLQVLLKARVSLYPARGEFQLVVDEMEEAGEGLLRRRFEALKHKLQEEGLFDPAHKQPLPRLPNRIGVITSPTGAAIRDVLTVLARRFPSVPVLIYPTPVQGDGAAAEIAATLDLADRRRDCDVLLLTRGGGSLEDLWAFNEEIVARAVHRCSIPVIAGVGHEVDVTITDFVADLRAPTPSGAAELVVPDRRELHRGLADLSRRLRRMTEQQVAALSKHYQQLQHRLGRVHPGVRLESMSQQLDYLEERLLRRTSERLQGAQGQIAKLEQRLRGAHPGHRLTVIERRLPDLMRALSRSMDRVIETKKQQLSLVSRGLQSVSPLATLERGYAIVTSDSRVVQSSSDVDVSDSIDVRLSEGSLEATVTKVRRPD